jgi:cytochrome oxidase assembly protein ShyY1
MVMVGGGYVFGETFDRIGIENLTAVSILLLIIFSLSLWQLWRKEKETALNKTSTPSILK